MHYIFHFSSPLSTSAKSLQESVKSPSLKLKISFGGLSKKYSPPISPPIMDSPNLTTGSASTADRKSATCPAENLAPKSNKFPKFQILPPRNNKDQVEEENKKIEAASGPKIPILPYKEQSEIMSSDDTEAEVISDFSDDNSSINYSDNDNSNNLKLPQPILTTKRGRGRPPGRGKESILKRGSGGFKLSIKPIKAPDEKTVSQIQFEYEIREIELLLTFSLLKKLVKLLPPLKSILLYCFNFSRRELWKITELCP